MQASDLGQAVTSANPVIHLISFLADTVAVRRTQTYVVFVTDATVAATVGNYEWAINDAGTVHNLTTSVGVMDYTPQAIGTLTITVRLRNTANSADIVSITMTKSVVALFTALELLIDQQESNTPRAAHPETSREIVNDLRGYIDAIVPAADALNPLLLALTYGTLLREPTRRGGAAAEVLPGPRMVRLELCASRLNATPATSFLADAGSGIGVCQLRPQLLALYLVKPGGAATYLPARTLRAGTADRRADMTQWETDFNALPATDQLDLFNLVRFPKTCFRVTQTVIEGLAHTFFPSDTLPGVLADPAKTRQLIAQYRSGPVMPITSLAPGGSDSRIQQFMLLPLWLITPRLVLSPAGGGAGTAGGGATPPAPVGSPEQMPEHTFIANFVTESTHPQTGVSLSTADKAANIHLNGFIRNAVVYHETYDLFQRNVISPNFIDSFEELIEKLSQLPAAHLNRIRIVSHVYINDAGVDSGTNIMVPFFRNQKLGLRGAGHTLLWHFAYGTSDEAGMQAYLLENQIRPLEHPLTENFTVPVSTRPDPQHAGQTIDVQRQLVDVILDILRQPANRSVLAPFQLTAPGSRPTGNVAKFIRICCDLFVLANTTELVLQDQTQPPLQRTFSNTSAPFRAVVNRITDILSTFQPTLVVAGRITAQDLTDLRQAILARALSEFPLPINPFIETFVTDDTAILQNHDTLRANLAIVRGKFSRQSSIDIRGCRLGQDPAAYGPTLQGFLGSTGNLPALSSPDWFQMFPTMGFITNPTEALIDASFQNGVRIGSQFIFSAADVQRDYSTWAGRMGIPAHLAFWQRLTAATNDSLEFLAYDWRNALPGAGLQAVQLQGFAALPFNTAIVRLSQVFNVPAATVPAPATVQTFTTSLLPLATRLWHTATSLTSLTASTPVAELTPHLTELTTIASDPAVSQTLPPAPNPLTLAHLAACVTQLKGHLTTQLNIAPFLAAIQTQLGAPTAGIRYMQRVGLPLPVQRGGNEIDVRLILFDSLKDDAARNWMRAQWTTLSPAAEATISGLTINWAGTPMNDQGTTTPTDDTLNDLGKGTQAAALTDTRTNTTVAVCPMYEYAQHIVIVPATP